MGEYLAPGVYVEEFESGPKAMEGVGTSTAGFVGLAVRGPVVGRPVLVTNFADYQRRFGGFLSEVEYRDYRFMPNCAEQFFTNGGTALYVMRVVPDDAETAQSPDSAPIKVVAKDPGAWGNTVQVLLTGSVRAKTQVMDVSDGASGKQYHLKNAAGFRAGDLVALRTADGVTYNKITEVNGMSVTMAEDLPDNAVDANLVPATQLEACGVDAVVRWGDLEEQYPGCSLNENAPDYLAQALEKSTLASITLDLKDDKADDPLKLLGAADGAAELRVELSGGLNGTMDQVNAGTFKGEDKGPGQRSGIEAFQEITDVSIMAVPGVSDPEVQAQLIAHCEGLTSRFAVLDAPLSATGVDELTKHRSTYDSSYAALYAPWVRVYDSLLKRPVFIPPSGSICGIYARTDVNRGVHKAPANEVVQGCTGLSVAYNAAEQGKLNPSGINLIRAISGQGIRVWGARTCSSNSIWRYVNVRRLFIFLEESIRANTGWVVFEPNDEGLWSRVKGSLELFLKTQWRNGALSGATEDEAFYVDVGRSTMSQDDIDNGRLICEIGVAPVKPAEFVIFRITQKTQNAT